MSSFLYFNPLACFTLCLFFSGPTLYTLCTAVIDLDQHTVSIIQGNPQKEEVSHIFTMSSKDLKLLC